MAKATAKKGTVVVQMQAVTVKALSGAILAGFFNGSDAEQISGKVAALEQPRIAYLFSFFPQTDAADVRKAAKEYREDAKKTHGPDSPQYRTAKVRAAEVVTLDGAWRHAGFKPEGMGYGAAVSAARTALKAKNIRANGQSIPSETEKRIGKEASLIAAQYQEVEMARHKAEATGTAFTDADAEKVRAATKDARDKAGAVSMAATLFKSKGADFCGWLVEALDALQAVAAQEEGQVKAQAQA